MEEIIQEALSKGVEMPVAAEFELANKKYSAVMKLQPKHADANHSMGLLKGGYGLSPGGVTLFADRVAGRQKRGSVLAQLHKGTY